MSAPAPLAQCDAVVVGAGPAGLMAAEALAAAGRSVIVIDRMPSAGRKLLMAGRSGLNLTHAEPDESFLARYGESRAMVEAAIRAFPPRALQDWAADLGQPTFVGSSGRIFPESMKASPLLRAWLRRLDASGVRLLLNSRFTGFADGGIAVETRDDGPSVILAGATVLAMGGASWPRLGSDASWVGTLEAAGAPVTPFQPSNCGLVIGWSDVLRERFHGQPLKRLAVSFGARVERSEAVVTRTGLEGGAVYPLSVAIGAALARGETAQITLDLRPDLSRDDLAVRLKDARQKDSLANRLRKAAGLPPVATAILREGWGVTLPTVPAALASAIKAVPLTVSGVSGLERAISSSGGVARAGLYADFMLAARPGTFAAGEMLDWDAPTGGYLLQASLATGRAAGEAAARWLAHH